MIGRRCVKDQVTFGPNATLRPTSMLVREFTTNAFHRARRFANEDERHDRQCDDE